MSQTERTSRIDEERDLEARKNLIRKKLMMGSPDKLHVNPDEIPDGMEYRWVRDTIFGDPAFSRVGYMKGRGWTPVPSSRHPNIFQGAVPWRTDNKAAFIFCDGLVLCERPAEFGEIEKELAEEHNMRVLLQTPGNAAFMSDPSMPSKVYSHEVGIQKVRTFQKDS